MTRLIHGGHGEASLGVAPVEQRSTTFRLDPAADEVLASRVGVDRLDVYGRFGTETTRDAARLVADLEGGDRGLLTASGMAAVHGVFMGLVPPGGRVIAAAGLYGGTDALLEHDLPARGVTVARFDPERPETLDALLSHAPADLVWCEAISNPLMGVADLDGIGQRCRAAGVTFGVDATFSAGMAVRPIERGAHVVMHSATKFLNGHGDVVAGAIVGDAARVDAAYQVVTRTGGCIDPHGAWLLARGIRTLPLRWERQQATARRLAVDLAEHPAVARVRYPGLDDRAAARLEGPGAMLAFELADPDPARAREVVFGLDLCVHATSLGGLETLVSVPARSSHANLAPERLAELGIAPGLIRVSVGLEDHADLRADLFAALER